MPRTESPWYRGRAPKGAGHLSGIRSHTAGPRGARLTGPLPPVREPYAKRTEEDNLTRYTRWTETLLDGPPRTRCWAQAARTAFGAEQDMVIAGFARSSRQSSLNGPLRPSGEV